MTNPLRRLRACPHCASLRLRAPSVQENAAGWVAELDVWMCQNCRTTGVPIEFEGEEEWREFARALEEEREGAATPPPAPPKSGPL